MKSMKVIVIDDEPIALDIVRSLAANVSFLEIKAEFTNSFDAMQYLQKEIIDLIFLDIRMPVISGIDFLSTLNKRPLVVFTTAYSEHAVTSFELDAVDYLLKPFSLVRFTKACNKAYELFNLRSSATPNDFLFVKTGYEQVKTHFEDILFIEATGNYVSFILKGKKILSRMTMREVEEVVPSGRFMRVHRSFIVSIDKIDKIERHQVVINGNFIPVSDSYVQKINKLVP